PRRLSPRRRLRSGCRGAPWHRYGRSVLGGHELPRPFLLWRQSLGALGPLWPHSRRQDPRKAIRAAASHQARFTLLGVPAVLIGRERGIHSSFVYWIVSVRGWSPCRNRRMTLGSGSNTSNAVLPSKRQKSVILCVAPGVTVRHFASPEPGNWAG